MSTDQLTASALSHGTNVPGSTGTGTFSNNNNNNNDNDNSQHLHNHNRRRSIIWQDNNQSHHVLPQRPFSADFTNTFNYHSNSLLQQGYCYMVMDDDLVSEKHEEIEEERKSGEIIIMDDSVASEGIGPSHTGSTTTTTAPTTSTTRMSCLVAEQPQSFGLFRRLSKFGYSSGNTSNTPMISKAPRRATSLLVSTTSTTTNNNNSTFCSFNTHQQQKPTTTTIKFDDDEFDNNSLRPVLGRSMSLSNYYRRRFSSLIVHNNTNNLSTNEFGNSMTRARSVFIRNKQDRAVAIWRRSVAQLDLSSAGVISSSPSNTCSPLPTSLVSYLYIYINPG